jgi:hypothetical protein
MMALVALWQRFDPAGVHSKEEPMAKYSRSTGKQVESALSRRKKGTLKKGKGGKGGTVKSEKQAIAIGLSEARKKGKKAPKKATGKKSAKRKTARRWTTHKAGG